VDDKPDGSSSHFENDKKRGRVDDLFGELFQKIDALPPNDRLRTIFRQQLSDMQQHLQKQGIVFAKMDPREDSNLFQVGGVVGVVLKDGKTFTVSHTPENGEIFAWSVVTGDGDDEIEYLDGNPLRRVGQMRRNLGRNRVRVTVAGHVNVRVAEDVEEGDLLFAGTKGVAKRTPMYDQQRPLGIAMNKSRHGKVLAFVSDMLQQIVRTEQAHPALSELNVTAETPRVERELRQMYADEKWIFQFENPKWFFLKWLHPDNRFLKECGLIVVGHENEGYIVMAESKAHKIVLGKFRYVPYRRNKELTRFLSSEVKSVFVDTGLSAASVSHSDAQILLNEFASCRDFDFSEIRFDYPELKLQYPSKFYFDSFKLLRGSISGGNFPKISGIKVHFVSAQKFSLFTEEKRTDENN